MLLSISGLNTLGRFLRILEVEQVFLNTTNLCFLCFLFHRYSRCLLAFIGVILSSLKLCLVHLLSMYIEVGVWVGEGLWYYLIKLNLKLLIIFAEYKSPIPLIIAIILTKINSHINITFSIFFWFLLQGTIYMEVINTTIRYTLSSLFRFFAETARVFVLVPRLNIFEFHLGVIRHIYYLCGEETAGDMAPMVAIRHFLHYTISSFTNTTYLFLFRLLNSALFTDNVINFLFINIYLLLFHFWSVNSVALEMAHGWAILDNAHCHTETCNLGKKKYLDFLLHFFGH